MNCERLKGGGRLPENTLIIKELHFDASHYLDGTFGKCQYIHGHRWYVKNLVIKTSKIVDFGLIKKAINNFDHCKIIPEEHVKFWSRVQSLIQEYDMPFKIRWIAIPFKLTLVENIKEEVKKNLLAIDGVEEVKFELYETDNAGVRVE